MIQEAVGILKEYSCVQTKTVTNATEKERLTKAILLVTELSEYQNLGICADNVAQGLESLQSYLVGLGYQLQLPTIEQKPPGAVYIKFNTQKQNFYVDDYEGDYRGVLISCQGDNQEVMGTYGYFPLDLFGG
jgi:hypothetical protein